MSGGGTAPVIESSTSSVNQRSTPLANRSTSSAENPSALPTCRIAMRGWKVTTLQTIPVRSHPYLSYTYWITCSRCSVEKSMSMSGVLVISSCRKRSKRRLCALKPLCDGERDRPVPLSDALEAKLVEKRERGLTFRHGIAGKADLSKVENE